MSSAAEQFAERAGWTVPGLLRVRSELSPNEAALWQFSAAGRWEASAWGDYRETVAAFALGFVKLGLAAGERVGIMAANCKEWDYSQLGIMAAGGVVVGLDPYASDEHTQQIAQRCGLRGLVIDKLERLAHIGEETRSNLGFVLCFEAQAASGIVNLEKLVADAANQDDWNRAQADQVATIIFTSGTTGEPKGVAYTHRQMCLAAADIVEVFADLPAGSRLACWLPLSNLFQRMINVCAIAVGAQVFYVADPKEIVRLVPGIAPHVLIGVPRFYEKLHAGIEQALTAKPRWQRQLAQWALHTGDEHARAMREGGSAGVWLELRWRVAEALVLKKLRAILGGSISFMVSGSAPMALHLLEWFDAIGLRILEAYGMSENITPVAINRPRAFRFGTVGRPLRSSTVRLADDGELLICGPGVFKGYLDGDTDARIDGDGFLASGDFATIDADGFITLVGRKSEIFKTSTGRRVAPAGIESHLRRLRQVEHAAVFGAGRSVPTALLITQPQAWRQNPQQFCRDLRSEAAFVLAELPAHLRPAGVAITDRPFTLEGGELTANLKMRRRTIEENFAPLLRELEACIDAAAGASFEAQSQDGQALLISL